MQQISISDIQRNLHKLNNFDIIEVVDKKKNKIKGYFIDSKYIYIIQQLIDINNKKNIINTAGSLQHYANPSLMEKEKEAWQQHTARKYQL